MLFKKKNQTQIYQDEKNPVYYIDVFNFAIGNWSVKKYDRFF